MRALLLFSVVVLSFILVHCLGASPMAREEGEPPVSASVAFLPPPATAAQVTTQVEPTAPPSPPSEFLEAAEQADESSVADPDTEIAVAAALVHGTPADVQAAAAGLPASRARLAEAFAWAVAGEQKLAVSLSAKIGRDEVPGSERALLEAVLSTKAVAPASVDEGPVALGMHMALLAREARRALEIHQYQEAARLYTALFLKEFDAPWTPDARTLGDWTLALSEAQRNHRWDPRGAWPAVEQVVQSGDSLISIRKRFLAERPGTLMCTGLIERANRVEGYLQPGQRLRVPADEARVIVDLEARWALYLLGDEVACAWPVGIGRPGEDTPPGSYTVKDKIENPPWMKVGQEAIPFGDPRNPLGTRWVGWELDGRKTSYGFHGTQDPDSIGKAESDGCIRFRNPDIEELFQILPEGAPILIQR